MKKLIIKLLCVNLLMFSCVQNPQEDSCVMDEEEITIMDATTKEFQSLITSDVIILDVRTPEEFSQGHIENAINIDFLQDDFLSKAKEIDNSKVLLVYCAAGGRSGKAMRKLSENGFNTIYNLAGGFTQWNNDGLPSVQ